MSTSDIRREIGRICRDERAMVLATLARTFRDLDLAEDAVQAAFAAAAEQWPRDGVPEHPRAWLVAAGRFRAIDAVRRQVKLFAALRDLSERPETRSEPFPLPAAIEDDRLRLIFLCSHPELSLEGQCALTLREVCGLTTEEIARAFLTTPTTVAQRIVRAKAKIREADIPFELPGHDELETRRGAVLRVVYLLFNEGYYASSGSSLTRGRLSQEAIRLGRLLAEIDPHPEGWGLLGLMLLHESRREARVGSEGELVLFANQDPAKWDAATAAAGISFARASMEVEVPGEYAIQAAISACHIRAGLTGEPCWDRVVDLYDMLLARTASPVVALNRAVAVAMRDGPEAALAVVDGLIEGGPLAEYGLAHAARADFYRRLGRWSEAQRAYRQALDRANLGAERGFLAGRIREMDEKLENRTEEMSN